MNATEVTIEFMASFHDDAEPSYVHYIVPERDLYLAIGSAIKDFYETVEFKYLTSITAKPFNAKILDKE